MCYYLILSLHKALDDDEASDTDQVKPKKKSDTATAGSV